jgi:hypothetical protein
MEMLNGAFNIACHFSENTDNLEQLSISGLKYGLFT